MNLTELYYDEQTFKDLTITHEHLSDIEFTSCTFIKLWFSESNFAFSSFDDCLFKDCNLSLTKFHGSK